MRKGDLSNFAAPEIWISSSVLFRIKQRKLFFLSFSRFELRKDVLAWLWRVGASFKIVVVWATPIPKILPKCDLISEMLYLRPEELALWLDANPRIIEYLYRSGDFIPCAHAREYDGSWRQYRSM